MQRLFPDLGGEWRMVDLNALHVKSGATANIVSDLKAQEQLLAKAAEKVNIRTYGGFGEDRDRLWFDSGQPQIHLGVDFNQLPPGQRVRSVTSGRVIDVLRDTDTVNGWGGRVMVQTDQERYVLYGHLEHKHLPAVGDVLRAGDEIGRIAAAPENGGWFPHLHLQYMTAVFVAPYLDSGKMAELDGYAVGSTSVPDGVLDPLTL